MTLTLRQALDVQTVIDAVFVAMVDWAPVPSEHGPDVSAALARLADDAAAVIASTSQRPEAAQNPDGALAGNDGRGQEGQPPPAAEATAPTAPR